MAYPPIITPSLLTGFLQGYLQARNNRLIFDNIIEKNKIKEQVAKDMLTASNMRCTYCERSLFGVKTNCEGCGAPK